MKKQRKLHVFLCRTALYFVILLGLLYFYIFWAQTFLYFVILLGLLYFFSYLGQGQGGFIYNEF